jgi:hypothetical protein
MISIQCVHKGKLRHHKASLPGRRQKASVICGMKTLPEERGSFVMNDFGFWWTEILKENKEHGCHFCAQVVILGQAC